MLILILASLIPAANAAGGGPARVPVPVEVNVDALRAKLKQSGFNVASVVAGPPNYIQWGPGGETKDPAPVIESLMEPTMVRMRSLARKWKVGSISAAEKDELLMFLVLHMLGLP